MYKYARHALHQPVSFPIKLPSITYYKSIMRFAPILLVLFAGVSLAAPVGLEGGDIKAKPDDQHATRDNHAGVSPDDTHATRDDSTMTLKLDANGFRTDDAHTSRDMHATVSPDNDVEVSTDNSHMTGDNVRGRAGEVL